MNIHQEISEGTDIIQRPGDAVYKCPGASIPVDHTTQNTGMVIAEVSLFQPEQSLLVIGNIECCVNFSAGGTLCNHGIVCSTAKRKCQGIQHD